MEDDFVTIMTFTLPHEVAVIRARLESEDIECNVQNELTVQVYNFYSNAIGGIKLQVKEKDWENALVIMKEVGYFQEEAKESSEFTKQVEKVISSIHLHSKKIIIAVVAMIGGGWGLSTYMEKGVIETLNIQLIRKDWCLEQIKYNGKVLNPITTGPVAQMYGDRCETRIKFLGNGLVNLPGINTGRPQGVWGVIGDSLYIYGLDTLNEIYGGAYKTEMNNDVLTLRSDSCAMSVRCDF
jgi:hypothetical protein